MTARHKEDSPHACVEEAGVAYDPTTQYLDLTKDEKRRTTALMMAVQAYKELIIKDADYLREVISESRRVDSPMQIRPATIDAMLDAACKFDLFIAGTLTDELSEETRGGAQQEAV
jgi:hypothetical protein